MQRIRDPLHNVVQFDTDKCAFERVYWKVIQTVPFQRLRRVKQLGFTDLVYPGATHSRFAHSVGVFHTARQLVGIVRRALGVDDVPKAQPALAAALLHDVGHGPFSHAFEDVGERLGLKMADHEHVSDALIRDSEITQVLHELGSGFANDVADIIGNVGERNIYRAIVSSQFDADRLDYMRRDRLMTGTHHGGIDFEWLLANLEVGEVPYAVDDTLVRSVQTFVLGPKATLAAEAFVLGLFQLYPTVYLHKTTRGAQTLFTELMVRVFDLARANEISKTGLPRNHPLIKFARAPDRLEYALRLDDTVVLGSLAMLAESKDKLIREFAVRLSERRLFKCIDIRSELVRIMPAANDGRLTKAIENVRDGIEDWALNNSEEVPRLLVDEARRTPYNRITESKGPLNQIIVRTPRGLVDLGGLSDVVGGLKSFEAFRVYFAAEDTEARRAVAGLLEKEKRTPK